jgi:putative transposase
MPKLPHILPYGATFFVTFNLQGAIPKAVLAKLAEQRKFWLNQIQKTEEGDAKEKLIAEHKRQFANYDKYLDNPTDSPLWLKEEAVANIVAAEIMKMEQEEKWEVIAYSIMPNHVHLLVSLAVQLPENIHEFKETDYFQLNDLLQLVKGRSSRYSNLTLGRSGTFWQKDSYDHYIRNTEEFNNIVHYILQNPVKAGLVTQYSDWKFNYLNEKFL